MTYNPILDLVVGLLLILLPVAILSWLGIAWALLAGKEKSDSETDEKSPGHACLDGVTSHLHELLRTDGAVAPELRGEVEAFLSASESVRPLLSETPSQPDPNAQPDA